jgi:four helix bundle protein
MMRRKAINSFEDLMSWQQAIELARDVYAMTQSGSFSKDFGLRDQTRRAVVSVSANIAEGFERRTSKEYIHFLSIAKGSAGEVRSLLRIAFEVGYLEKTEYEALRDRMIGLSRLLAGQIRAIRSRRKAALRPERTVSKLSQ